LASTLPRLISFYSELGTEKWELLSALPFRAVDERRRCTLLQLQKLKKKLQIHGEKWQDFSSECLQFSELSAYSHCAFVPTRGAQVRRALGVGRTQSRASSSLREYRNLFAKAANFLSQADASTHPPLHRESVLRCWPQAASREIDSLRVPRVPRSRNRGLRSFPVQALYLRYSKASLQLNHAEHHVLSPQHPDRRDLRAIHRLSVEEPIAHAQASAQAWFFPNKEVQPSNVESPHLLLLEQVGLQLQR
jgi:hypothetical protein